MRAIWGFGGACVAAAAMAIFACVGTEAPLSAARAEGTEGGRCHTNGTCDTGLSCIGGYCVRPDGSVAGPDASTDAGTDGAIPGAACPGTFQSTPCGCPTGNSCCPADDGGYTCEPPNAAQPCASTRVLRCVNTSGCAPDGPVCCLNQKLLANGACPVLPVYDSSCESFDASTTTCTGEVLCGQDSECTRLDAGRCVRGIVSGTDRYLGVCLRD